MESGYKSRCISKLNIVKWVTEILQKYLCNIAMFLHSFTLFSKTSTHFNYTKVLSMRGPKVSQTGQPLENIDEDETSRPDSFTSTYLTTKCYKS